MYAYPFTFFLFFSSNRSPEDFITRTPLVNSCRIWRGVREVCDGCLAVHRAGPQAEPRRFCPRCWHHAGSRACIGQAGHLRLPPASLWVVVCDGVVLHLDEPVSGAAEGPTTSAAHQCWRSYKFVSHVAVEHGASTRVGHMLFAMVLRHFTNSFLELQIDCLAKKENTIPAVQLDDDDRNVIAYICGCVIRRVLAKGLAYREGLASVLGSREPAVGMPSEWITSKVRGGLLYPSRDFFAFMEGCEQTLRGLTDLERLSADSLLRDQLKEDLLENPSLQQCWDLIGGSADTLMREKVTDLFLTIRGHASARRVMRQYAKTQAANRSTKGLCKSLQSHFQDSA